MKNNLDSDNNVPVFEMGLSDGQTASLVGFEDKSLAELLEAVGVKIVDAKKSGRRDHYFVYMDSIEATITFGLLKRRQGSSGAIWAIFNKNNEQFPQADILAAAKEKGLVPAFDTNYQQHYKMIKFVLEPIDLE